MSENKKPRILFRKLTNNAWASIEKNELNAPKYRIERSNTYFQKNARYSIYESWRFLKGELETPKAVREWLENYVEKLNSAGS